MKGSVWFVLALSVTAPTLAGDDAPQLCYEDIGCVQERNISARDAEKLGCDQLWTVRNGIYAARGYCFSTERGLAEFGNQGCRYSDQSAVPLNDYERANVRLIHSIEKRRGC
ncbi:MAG: YARHG domain-containing protein [Hyphomicrobium sp.]|jgi:hypothetical protein